MRHQLIAALSLVAVSLFLHACSDEGTPVKIVNFDVKGIELTQMWTTTWHGRMPSTGGEVTLTATGKNKKEGYLSAIHAPELDLVLTGEERKEPLPYTVCEEAWGKVEILSNSPHTTRITFHPNNSGKVYSCEFDFGGTDTTQVYITRLAQMAF